MKVVIKGAPSDKGSEIKVNKTLQPVDREDSNMEVEKGEFIVCDTMFSGFPETYVAGGERHSNGGTPVNLPENTFVFSRDKALKIKDSEIQESFGKKEKESGYTFADIAKQYNVNDYRKILADPNTDDLQRETAQDMIKNYNEKLGKLALVQESMKGFPQNMPFISIPYLESMGIDPAKFVNGGDGQEAEVPIQNEEDIPQKKFGGMNIRVLKKPVFQSGGSKNKDKEPVYSDTQLANMQKLKKLGYNLNVPGTVNDQHGAVDKMQSDNSGTYGRKNWSDPSLFSDFKNRSAWYLKDHPDFDPKKEKDVKDFQNAYNNKLVGMGLQPELNPDGKFGEHTYSVYDLNKKPVVQKGPEPVVNVNKPADLEYKGDPTKRVASAENPFWTQDLVNLSGAVQDGNKIKKYMPWQSGYNTQLPEGIYYDPTRELAANSEQVNMANNVTAQFSGPQQLNSRMSEINGQGLSNAANILGKYNELNVGVANTLEGNQTAIMNQDSANRANQATGLFDKTTIVNQNFDNAKAQARQNVRNAINTAWTNRGKTQGLNSMNKQYRVDPRTGYVEFTGVPGNIDPTKQHQQILDYYQELMKDPNLRSNPDHAKVLLNLYAKGLGVQPDSELPYDAYSQSH